MTAIRTSQTHPLQIAFVKASADQGRIGITFCPGKHGLKAATGIWKRYLELDLDAVKKVGCTFRLDVGRTARTDTCMCLALAKPYSYEASNGSIYRSEILELILRNSRKAGSDTALKFGALCAMELMFFFTAREDRGGRV